MLWTVETVKRETGKMQADVEVESESLNERANPSVRQLVNLRQVLSLFASVLWVAGEVAPNLVPTSLLSMKGRSHVAS